MFVNDTWSVGRATLNAGFRYDRYHGWLPEQEQLAGRCRVGQQFPSLASLVTAKTFPETHFYTWNVAAPRIGLTFDLSGDGKTVLKGNYGLYWHNPGVGVGGNANPNTAGKSATYTWTDINGDQRWQPGEEITRTVGVARRRASASIRTSRRPYTHEASAWIERQLTDTMGVRAGFVYKTEDDLIATYQPGRGLSAPTPVPFNFTDIGVDGRSRHRGRPHHPDARLPELAGGGNFPTNAGRDERAALLALQDRRSLDEQALRQPLVGLDGLRLHDA